MQVQVETVDKLGRKVTIQVPSDHIDSQVKERLQSLAKTAKVDGFRPGKVPAGLLEKRFGESVRHEILEKTLQNSLYEAITQEKLNPAGTPNVEITNFKAGEPLEFVATFDVYPTIEPKGLKDQEIELWKAEVKEADVDDLLNKLRKQHADWSEVDRAAKKDDRVIIDFEGFMDGKPFEGGKANDAPLVLGSNTMIPGFEDGILGAKKDEEREIKVTFPKDYRATELAGKEATFKIKVHKVLEPKLPELNDELAKQFGIEEGGLNALRAEVEKNMKTELANALLRHKKQAVMDKLLELNEIEIPKALVENEIEHLRRDMMMRMGVDESAKEKPDLPNALFEEQAKRRVSLGLLIAELVKLHKIKPDAEKVRKMVEETAGAYKDAQSIIDWYYADKKRLAQFEMLIMEDLVVEKMLEDATTKDVEKAYNEVVS